MAGLGVLLYAVVALALLLSGLRPDARPWGLHSYAFLPRSMWIGAALVLAAGLVPGVAARLGVLATRLGSLLTRSLVLPVVVAGVAVPCFYLARLEAHLLGDATVWVGALAEGMEFHHFEPLAAFLTRWLAMLLSPSDPATAAGALSIVLGPVYIVCTAILCRWLWRQPSQCGASWLLLLLHPLLLLYFGYVESYPLVVVLQVVFVMALAGAASGRVPTYVAAVVLGLALAAHLAAVAWMPALGVFVWQRASTRRARLAHTTAALALATVIAVAGAGSVGGTPGHLWRDVVGEPGLGGQSLAWFFSSRHVVDWMNEMLLLLAPVFVLLAGAAAVRQRPARTTDAQRPLWDAIVTLGAGTLAVAVAVEPRIGGARDWDLFVPLVLPAVLLAVRASTGAPAAATGRAILLATVLLSGWLVVGVDASRAAARLEVLQDERGTFSNFARGYANESLGIYYRGRNPEAARAAWQRATRANPKNPRYFNNLGMEELKRNDIAAACSAFRRTLELGMDEYFTRFNVANCDRQEGDLAAAERHYDQLIARWPQRPEAFAARGWARVQMGRPEAALADLNTALRLGPPQPEVFYSMGLALQALGREPEARRAWERTLQLDPRHEAARTRLQSSAQARDAAVPAP